MKKILDKIFYIFMDEYYVLHFHQVKPKIKYYVVKVFKYNMYT